MTVRAASRFVWLAVGSAGVAAGLALFSVTLNLFDRSLPREEQMIPALMRARDAAAWLPALALVFFGWRLMRKVLPAVKERSVRLRLLASLGTLVLVVAAILGTMLLHLALHPNWLFSRPYPMASARSPDGRHTAYLTRSCFLLCTFEVHLHQGGPTMHLLGVVQSKEAGVPPTTLRWDSDSSVLRVYDEQGTELLAASAPAAHPAPLRR